MICSICGARLSDDSLFCGECGQKITLDSVSADPSFVSAAEFSETQSVKEAVDDSRAVAPPAKPFSKENLFDPQQTKTADAAPKEDRSSQATAGFVLGLVGIVAWLIPLVGLPVTIVGLVLSIKGRRSSKRGLSVAGMVLSIVFLAVTVINLIWGVLLALLATARYLF
jgi:hypothetical protein